MKKVFLTILIVLLVLVSCEKSNDSYSESLDGTWMLQKAICYCYFGDDFNFEEHQIVINQQNSSLLIENSDETRFINEAGEYQLEINGNQLSINKNQKYTFVQNENSLTLSFVDNPNIADDEITLEYIRIE